HREKDSPNPPTKIGRCNFTTMILRAFWMAISSRIDQKSTSQNSTGDRTQLSLPTDACKINSQASR
ncbi:MAG: hypothetical protein ACYT04_43040, partial [Nostoc sp.]